MKKQSHANCRQLDVQAVVRLNYTTEVYVMKIRIKFLQRPEL